MLLYLYIVCFTDMHGIQMLLKHFDTNKKYIGSKKTTAVFNGKAVSLLLHTDSGGQPLTDDHVVNGWKLKPKEDLTVYSKMMVYNLTFCCYSRIVCLYFIVCMFIHVS